MPKLADELGALAVKRLTEPGMHFVGVVPGLALHITRDGARSWILRVMVAGKRREMGLGGYPAVQLADAHRLARAAREAVATGRDPVAERQAAKSALRASSVAAQTFKTVALAYIAAHEATWRNAKHGQQWRNTLEAYAFPKIGAVLVQDIQREHVLEVLRPIWTEKTETAKRLRGRIELVLSYAMQAGYRSEGLNPARWRGGLDKLLASPAKVAPVEHHRALPIDGMPDFMHRLRGAPGEGARALEFAILTAARSAEVRGATWGEIDLDARLWTIPGRRMKAGKEHRVPLSDAALALLVKPDSAKPDDLVFRAARTGGTLSDMTLTAVLRRMEVPAVPHGFRSTFRDWAAERTNYPHEMAEMALAHSVADKVEAAYRRGDMLAKRAAMMGEWAAFIGPKKK